MKMKLKLKILVLVLIPFGIFAQSVEDEINIAGFRFLDYNNQLPDELLSSKTAVFVSLPPKSRNTSERGDWKTFSETAHSQFKKMGIDAVAYYFMDDLKAGNDPALFYSKELEKRQVKNIILLSQVPLKIAGKVTERFVIVITPFNGENSFISNGQNAWKTQAKDYSKALKSLGKDVYRAKQPKTNFLIPDFPEFFEDAAIIKGRRIPPFARDLKVDKLAIPKSTTVEIPDSRPAGSSNKSDAQEITEYKQQAVKETTKRDNNKKHRPLTSQIPA